MDYNPAIKPLWQPLPHPECIRLLRFPTWKEKLGGIFDSHMNFSLITVRLSDAQRPPYSALSYTWGDDTKPHSITINDHETSIRSNLWNFLRRATASSELEATYLWLDALSISQLDPIEKAAQVQQIGRIFSTASRVIVWLGSSVPRANHWRKFRSSTSKAQARQMRNKMIWSALGSPYFFRRWIVQEILLARRLIIWFGTLTITLDELCSFECVNDIGFAPGIAVDAGFVTAWDRVVTAQNMLYMLRVKYDVQNDRRTPATLELAQFGDPSIFDLCRKFHYCECSVDHDRVYALLTLVQNSFRIPLQVDYTIDIVVLFYRTLSSAANVDFSQAEILIDILFKKDGIRELLVRSRELFPASPTTSNLEIVTRLDWKGFHDREFAWDFSWKLPPSDQIPSLLKARDAVAQFSPEVYLIFRKRSATARAYLLERLFTHDHEFVWAQHRVDLESCVGQDLPICLGEHHTPSITEASFPSKMGSNTTIDVTMKAYLWLLLAYYHWLDSPLVRK
ncbi:hypothetical protein H2200_010160 [Cladophialophora chaetospira]|uniref:Heterokaryon incompatibility domain-containing protein n=1 Tax=Cladophialophora chaetospira TaxID=386627 RepID=A0AA38X2G3_9EURO|nr:hypothetical protein H2200_010160 [Cladophialophora chaetospira]